ncbi:MAG: putative membrane protein [uncultured Acidimicrobiales bacterium]|uniref:Putative membrane protein n=1 Tax=uncultured Acidimicrobiales bacterium TaxID=310071 RepID=A0A6J4HF28_9ACTN|nr:MAG: putative membrane protein [uncultured Acidimicrobiales bacterium]
MGLLDDVAALAKLAAASVDDVGAAAGRASMKAAGVVVDDAAVTPGYVRGLAANRELPIVRKIAVGSLRNKVLFILPVALVLSSVAPALVEVILMAGGGYLCYEGAHKLIGAIRGDDHDHDVPAAMLGQDAEEATVSGAIRTDFILSAEIMVISLKEVIDEPILNRAAILAIVALLITVVVYGAVAAIVKMDDVGLALSTRGSESSQRAGRFLVRAMPVLLRGLSTVGIAAMLWVGGHILLVGADELGWHWPYGVVHDLEELVHAAPASAVLEWLVNTAASAAVGLSVGLAVNALVSKVRSARGGSAH